jgi:hypothetical protein
MTCPLSLKNTYTALVEPVALVRQVRLYRFWQWAILKIYALLKAV